LTSPPLNRSVIFRNVIDTSTDGSAQPWRALSLIEASSEPSRPVRPLPTRRRWRFDRVSPQFTVVLRVRVSGLASPVMRSIVQGGTLTDDVIHADTHDAIRLQR
jgi:hypothetical protein